MTHPSFRTSSPLAWAWITAALSAPSAAAQTPDVVRPPVEDEIRLVLFDHDEDFVPDRVGETITVRGCVNMTYRVARGSSQGDWYFVTIQDESGGIRLFSLDREHFEGLVPGDEVIATGTLHHRRGSEELRITSVERTGRVIDLQPVEALAREVSGEGMMHRLVRLEGELTDFDADGEYAVVADRSGSVRVRVTSRLLRDPRLNDLVHAGGPVSVVGIVTQADREAPFSEGYRLSPRVADDIAETPPPPWAQLFTAMVIALLALTATVYGIENRKARRRARELEAITADLDASRRHLEGTAKELDVLFSDDSTARFVLDADDRIIRCNLAMCDLLGGDEEAVLGRDITSLWKEREERPIESEEGGATRTEVVLYETGRLGLMTLTPVITDDGAMNIGSIIDISERARLEEQLLHAQKMDALGRLAGGVAHDINNMLAIILGNTEFARDASVDPEVVESLDEIRSAAERSGRMARQLLTVSRRDVPQPEMLDPSAVVEEMAPMLERIVAPGVVLALELSPSQSVRGDLGQIEQVILNLVVNASEAVGAFGTVRISVRDDVEGNVRLSVDDTGAGIPDADRDRVFEPFFSTKESGNGLGLATVYSIVTGVGGRVSVSEGPLGGAMIEVVLPGIAYSDASLGAGHAHQAEHPAARTVLVAEDEPGVRTTVTRYLERHAWTVLTAEDGLAALQLLERNADQLDVLLTDVRMPGMDGRALAAAARRIRPDLPIVTMSGYVHGADVPKSGEFRHFLQKPFAMGDLTSALDNAVQEALGAEAFPAQP